MEHRLLILSVLIRVCTRCCDDVELWFGASGLSVRGKKKASLRMHPRRAQHAFYFASRNCSNFLEIPLARSSYFRGDWPGLSTHCSVISLHPDSHPERLPEDLFGLLWVCITSMCVGAVEAKRA